jgi:hypothetical protein
MSGGYLNSRPMSCLRPLALVLMASGLAVAGGDAPARAAAGAPFLAHQALYNLSLLKSRGSAGINAVNGRILYDFSGSACEGYSSDFRQISELNSGEGKNTVMAQRSITWEDGAGKTFRFKIDTRMNDSESGGVDGVAERTGDHVTVKLKAPVAKTFTLDGSTVFPTEQIRRIIAAARDGKSILELSVYDGSDTGEKVYNTMTIIGQPISGDREGVVPDPSTLNDAMKSQTRWPVTVSYYDRDAKAASGDQTPVYAMSFELFENGVARNLVLDYNDFVLAGKVGKFDARQVKDAKEAGKDGKPCK